MNILALDVGTSSVKAAVLDTATGRAVGPIAHVAYAMDAPTPEAAEIHAERLWQAVAAAARAAVQGSGVSGRAGQDVQGIGLSCLTPALVLLDKSDRPLLPIWTHLDRAPPGRTPGVGCRRPGVSWHGWQSAPAGRHFGHVPPANAGPGPLPVA